MIVEKYRKYIIKDHITNFGGKQIVYRFPNGFGASVVNGPMLHLYSFYAEVAVIIFNGNEDYTLTYDTKITSDVEVLQNNKELKKILKRIKRLDKK